MPAPDSRRRLAAAALAAALLPAWPLPALAVLGEDSSTVQADQLRLAGVRRQAAGLAMQVHTISLPDGSTVREYSGADGRVFAVAWNTRSKPRLDQLLGRHFSGYAEGGAALMRRRPGVLHAGVVRRGDLVVEASAHLNHHVGRAWLQSMVPAGVQADALR